MARRTKKKEAHRAAGAPAWMVTFSDMTTLLLTFFVMLLSMANFDDLVRLNAVMESIRDALSLGNFEVKMTNHRDQESPYADAPSATDSVQPMVVRLREALAEHISDDRVRMTNQRTEVRIQLDDRVLFGPNDTAIHPSAYGLIGDIARAVANEPVNIICEGHTDATGSQRENWELSAERAVSVVMALQDQGPIPGERLQAHGFSHYHPLENTDGDPSDWNRRVEIVIQSDQRGAYSALDAVNALQGGEHGDQE